MEDQGLIVVLCTAPDDDAAEALAAGIVAEGLAACVNVVPGLRSHYIWDDSVQCSSEVQLLIKTRASLFPEVERWLLSHHPHEVPEIVALPVVGASQMYERWVLAQTVS
ncbi:MAG: divalent-cation tolerance protein CutA [Polyangiales bacterium]